MTETFDREAIQRGYDLAFAAGCFPSLTDDIAAFLAHYDAMAEALRLASCCVMPPEVYKKIDTVLSAYASQKEPGE